MAKTEKIKGSAITKIFEELINYRTLLSLDLLSADYKQLTRITALVDRNNEPHFIIDAPEQFEQAATRNAPWRIRFEFVGKDHIKYGFTTIGGEVHDSRIFVKMPRVIERNQRRKLFRINAPTGTKLCLTPAEMRIELEVINLSIGGSLAALVQTNPDLKRTPPFADTFLLKNAELAFPAEIIHPPIKIRAIQIKRMKMNAETKRYEVALEFCEVDNDEQQKLTEVIYQLQRQHLRKRLPLDI